MMPTYGPSLTWHFRATGGQPFPLSQAFKIKSCSEKIFKSYIEKTEKHWNSLVFILISYFFLQLMDFENFPTICLNFVCSWNGEWFPTCNSILWLCDFSSCPKQMKAVNEFFIFLIISIFLQGESKKNVT